MDITVQFDGIDFADKDEFLECGTIIRPRLQALISTSRQMRRENMRKLRDIVDTTTTRQSFQRP